MGGWTKRRETIEEGSTSAGGTRWSWLGEVRKHDVGHSSSKSGQIRFSPQTVPVGSHPRQPLFERLMQCKISTATAPPPPPPPPPRQPPPWLSARPPDHPSSALRKSPSLRRALASCVRPGRQRWGPTRRLMKIFITRENPQLSMPRMPRTLRKRCIGALLVLGQQAASPAV